VRAARPVPMAATRITTSRPTANGRRSPGAWVVSGQTAGGSQVSEGHGVEGSRVPAVDTSCSFLAPRSRLVPYRIAAGLALPHPVRNLLKATHHIKYSVQSQLTICLASHGRSEARFPTTRRGVRARMTVASVLRSPRKIGVGVTGKTSPLGSGPQAEKSDQRRQHPMHRGSSRRSEQGTASKHGKRSGPASHANRRQPVAVSSPEPQQQTVCRSTAFRPPVSRRLDTCDGEP
jgi:hypothetical protein